MGLWVGSYQAKGGEGLYPLRREEGRLVAGAAEPRIENGSFAVWSDRHRLAYIVDEQEDGRIGAWRHDGAWHRVAEVPSGGAMPCYLALSADHRWLACANYGDGTVTVFRLDPQSGGPVEIAGRHQPTGHGPDPERQDGPHAHCVLFGADDGELFHVDLGLDRVFRHRLEEGRIVGTDIAFAAPPGSGPRHLLFHPDGYALLICELVARLLLLRREGDGFTCLHAVPTAPEEASKDNLGGHLAIDADGIILVTNRGHDSLARFGLRDDRLEMLSWQPTGGASPRHLLPGDEILVAHEEGGGVTSLTRGAGHARPVSDIPSAPFILEIPD
jgi:6-phosphogluconolactonase